MSPPAGRCHPSFKAFRILARFWHGRGSQLFFAVCAHVFEKEVAKCDPIDVNGDSCRLRRDKPAADANREAAEYSG